MLIVKQSNRHFTYILDEVGGWRMVNLIDDAWYGESLMMGGEVIWSDSDFESVRKSAMNGGILESSGFTPSAFLSDGINRWASDRYVITM